MYTAILTLHLLMAKSTVVTTAYFESEEACMNFKQEIASAYGAYQMSSEPTEVKAVVCVNGKYGSVQ